MLCHTVEFDECCRRGVQHVIVHFCRTSQHTCLPCSNGHTLCSTAAHEGWNWDYPRSDDGANSTDLKTRNLESGGKCVECKSSGWQAHFPSLRTRPDGTAASSGAGPSGLMLGTAVALNTAPRNMHGGHSHINGGSKAGRHDMILIKGARGVLCQ